MSASQCHAQGLSTCWTCRISTPTAEPSTDLHLQSEVSAPDTVGSRGGGMNCRVFATASHYLKSIKVCLGGWGASLSLACSTPGKLVPKKNSLCPSLHPVGGREMVFCSHFPALAKFTPGHYCCETFPNARASSLPQKEGFWFPHFSGQLLIQGEATNAGGTAGIAASLAEAWGQLGWMVVSWAALQSLLSLSLLP